MDQKLHATALLILDKLLTQNFYALDFKKEHYDALVNALASKFDPDYIKDHRGTLKRAVADFFKRTHQDVSLSIFDQRIELSKNFSYPDKDEAYDRRMFKCDTKILEIKHDPARYRPVEILWLIPKDRRLELFSYFDDMDAGSDSVKEVIRDRFVELFALDETEIVLFLRNNIYIRKNATVSAKSSGERRFMGKDADLMEQLISQHFPVGVITEIESILEDTLKDRLNFSKVSNYRFIKSFIPVFRSMVEIILVTHVKELGKEDLMALSGYVLRKHFDTILMLTALNLLEYLEKRDKNAEAFIKYYDGSVTIDEDGNKTVRHAIVDARNQTWNFSSILANIIQWKESKARAHTFEEKIKSLVERQSVAEKALKEVEPSKRKADIEIDGVKQKVNANRAVFKKLKALSEKSSALLKKNEKELVKLRDLDRKLVGELREVYEKHDKVLKLYDNRAKELKNWQKQIADMAEQFKEALAKNKEIKSNRDGIVRGLISVFAKR
jgi:hypothetical protein